MACCTILSMTVGMPSFRTPPSALGISLRLTGFGLYLPNHMSDTSSRPCSVHQCSSSSTVIPSIPAAPLLPLTLFIASSKFLPRRISRSKSCVALSLSLLSRVPTLGTPAYPSRSTLSLCRQSFRYSAFIVLDSFLQLLKTGICSVLPVKKNGTMTSADFSQQALLHISDFLLYVCETSPGKNDNFHSM